MTDYICNYVIIHSDLRTCIKSALQYMQEHPYKYRVIRISPNTSGQIEAKLTYFEHPEKDWSISLEGNQQYVDLFSDYVSFTDEVFYKKKYLIVTNGENNNGTCIARLEFGLLKKSTRKIFIKIGSKDMELIGFVDHQIEGRCVLVRDEAFNEILYPAHACKGGYYVD